jgi:S-adenosylmethionine-diacylgycerolhomoserine-N-methlytransferase
MPAPGSAPSDPKTDHLRPNMENTHQTGRSSEQAGNMQSYYTFHAKIYDLTRWSFLFGRNEILTRIPAPAAGATLLEVGCGTGTNLKALAKLYPELNLIGVDVSPDMLERASKATQTISRRVLLFEKPYAPGSFNLDAPVDIVLFSYALTMFNPGWEAAIDRAVEDIKPGGYVAVVDFHDSPSKGFKWWMGQNHVRMDGHLLPYLQERFEDVHAEVKSAYLGVWKYVLYVGRKPE